MTRVGILGGTFNPVHLGHLLMAQDALEQAQLNWVEFVPCWMPPHKPAVKLAEAALRLRMLRSATRGHPMFRVNDIELRRQGRSYSVDTLEQMRRDRPAAQFYFIIGSDSLAELHRWRRIERLSELCSFVVMMRPGHPRCPVPSCARVEAWVEAHVCGISSSDVRKRIARGLSIHYLVPESVKRHIQQHKLYR